MNWRRSVAVIVALPLAAFFAFVGWNKAFAPLADLAKYHAWTIYIPEALGRVVGWSEMVLAVCLASVLQPASRRIPTIAALLLVLNQIAAGSVHFAQGEAAALPQNAVLTALLGLVTWLLRAPHPSTHKAEIA